ncbi:outer membrane lipoprotein-sorting protein [Pseudomonas ogarae]|uniref:DUF1329 domain-containing protein n=1 Tax=Pseudomonas ogarae (strain DSM 112162 / CECT 30235 / F113) TaxID=1114970 RepID=UPI0009A4588C|nr:DUF1329 domain-containing protein [Pseudomonas ogarae]OPG72113.1 outer membrane lipoprotein-sorting protein [Pseudomonas ogarae]
MKTKISKALQFSAMTLVILSAESIAAVSTEEANKLGTSLSPIGAEKAGNADGSIPAWTGGLPKNASTVDSAGFLGDPFASEKPLFSITKQNVEQYKDKLAPGQIALFKRYPDTYKMNIYPTHRTANLPDEVISDIKKNATKTTLIAGGNGLENFTGAYAFPIPQNGQEVIWNHITRYRGGSESRQFVEIVPDAKGGFNPVHAQELVAFPGHLTDDDSSSSSNILFYVKQSITSPPRLAGSVLLIHETIDQVKEPRLAWQYNAGERRVRRAPQLAYDGPGPSSDGQRTIDNFDLFSGAIDRYDWKLVGKKEIYIPYNSYKLDSPALKYTDIVRPGHMNPELLRYELHRVWHVTATLKSGARHIYAKRDFYFDEDTWQASVVDHYDGLDNLWRVAEAHNLFFYNHQVPLSTAETLHDLVGGRYVIVGLKNEEKSSYQFGVSASKNDFTPSALRQSGVR